MGTAKGSLLATGVRQAAAEPATGPPGQERTGDDRERKPDLERQRRVREQVARQRARRGEATSDDADGARVGEHLAHRLAHRTLRHVDAKPRHRPADAELDAILVLQDHLLDLDAVDEHAPGQRAQVERTLALDVLDLAVLRFDLRTFEHRGDDPIVTTVLS